MPESITSIYDEIDVKQRHIDTFHEDVNKWREKLSSAREMAKENH